LVVDLLMSRDFDERPRAEAAPIVEQLLGVVAVTTIVALITGAFMAFAG
jgi:hypothetical protein